MVDEWSGFADLLATLIEKYASKVLADDDETICEKTTNGISDNSCKTLKHSIDSGQAA